MDTGFILCEGGSVELVINGEGHECVLMILDGFFCGASFPCPSQHLINSQNSPFLVKTWRVAFSLGVCLRLCPKPIFVGLVDSNVNLSNVSSWSCYASTGWTQ